MHEQMQHSCETSQESSVEQDLQAETQHLTGEQAGPASATANGAEHLRLEKHLAAQVITDRIEARLTELERQMNAIEDKWAQNLETIQTMKTQVNYLLRTSNAYTVNRTRTLEKL